MKFKTIAYATLIAAASAAFVIGSGGTSEAKGKKMAAPPPGPCFEIAAPVCGAKGGMKFTYASSCFAARDGASVVSKGACHAPKAHKKHKKAKKMAKPEKKKEMKPAAKKPAAPAKKADDKKK